MGTECYVIEYVTTFHLMPFLPVVIAVGLFVVAGIWNIERHYAQSIRASNDHYLKQTQLSNDRVRGLNEGSW